MRLYRDSQIVEVTKKIFPKRIDKDDNELLIKNIEYDNQINNYTFENISITNTTSDRDDIQLNTIFCNTTMPTTLNKFCSKSFDSVLWWPQTQANTWAILPCFEEFKGVKYDSGQNATKFCYANGTWDEYTNYSQCHHSLIAPSVSEFSPGIELPAYIYCFGYCVSLGCLVLASIIFLSFRELRCLRNTIHSNLFFTYILSALLWMLTLFLQINDDANQTECVTLVMLFHYFNLTNFFWMFVEGLYLYSLIVNTFSNDNVTFTKYALIGWGLPAVSIIIWAILKPYFISTSDEPSSEIDIGCSWMRESSVDWVFQGPAAIVLLLNLIFLIKIMWILITKLRSANSMETCQYRKASKALLVLIPLFGITYLLVLIGPESGLSKNVFEILRAFLISTQGFFVALFFCFFNSEVKYTLRHSFDRWRNNRNLRRNILVHNHGQCSSKDYSQRTESIRLTSISSGACRHLE